MSTTRREHDPLLIKLALSPSLIGPAQLWVERHNQADGPNMNCAWIEDGILCANAYDLADLIRISNVEESSEFDVRKLKAEAIAAIEKSLARRRVPTTVRALRSALENLRIATIGEWKDLDLREAVPSEMSYIYLPLEAVPTPPRQ